jgi:hypothetical protein
MLSVSRRLRPHLWKLLIIPLILVHDRPVRFACAALLLLSVLWDVRTISRSRHADDERPS